MAKRSVIRAGLWVSACCAGGVIFSACGGLNSTHITVTDETGGSGGSAGASVSVIGGSAGKANGSAGQSGAGKGGSAGATQSGGSDAGGSAGSENSGGSGGLVVIGGSGGGGGAPSAGSGGQSFGGGGAGGTTSAGAGGQVAVGGGGAGGSGGAPGGPCNTLTQIGSSIPFTTATGNPPAMTRGALTAGTYVLTKQSGYNGTTGVAGWTTWSVTVSNNLATIQEAGSDATGTGTEHRTWQFDSAATPPLGVRITCSTDPTDPLNADLQGDWTATSTTLELTLGTYADYQFKKQ